MATVTEYYGSGGKTDKSEVGTWFWWVNGSSSSSRYGRSRLKVVYDSSDTNSTTYLTVTLQMARSNGDYNTHGTVSASLDGSSYSKYTYISRYCSKRSNADADSYIPDSYWTDICSKSINADCYANGTFKKTIWVSASCSADNMTLSGKSVELTGSTSYRYSMSSMTVGSGGGNHTNVWATCTVTSWGINGTSYGAGDYILGATLKNSSNDSTQYKQFTSGTPVNFYVGAQKNPLDYYIVFSMDNIRNNNFDKSDTVWNTDLWSFIPPSGPDNVNVSYSPNNEEPTIVSSYNLSWNEHNWGSVPDGCIRYFRMRIVVVNKNGVTQYIGYRYGNTNTPLLREWSDNSDIWYDFDDLRTGITICKDTYSGELAKLEVGDTISICVHSINHFDGKDFVSSSTWSNPIGPIQDDQAKVKLLDYNSQIVTGKVWVKDETGTWRKAKKIYVDTGTTSKNWEKSTNPTS